MMMELDQRVIERTESEQRNETKLYLNHPLLADMYELYSRYAFEKMLAEYMDSHCHYIPKMSKSLRKRLSTGTYVVKDFESNEKFQVKIKGK